MDWQTLRNKFMRTIGGDPPGAQLEDTLIAAYTEHPDAVERSIEKITLAHKAGKIRSPWGALKTEVAKATEAARNPQHNQGATREKATARAEQWLHAAGLHLDRVSEVEHELFGTATLEPTVTKAGEPIESAGSQLLAAWRDNHALRDRMVSLWRELRPRGIQAEQAADARGRAYAERRQQELAERQARLDAARADDTGPVTSDPDPDPEPVVETAQ